MEKQIVVYKAADDISLEVQTDGETVWLTQEQMCLLFGRTQPVIARHIANIFREGELTKEVVYAKNERSGICKICIHHPSWSYRW